MYIYLYGAYNDREKGRLSDNWKEGEILSECSIACTTAHDMPESVQLHTFKMHHRVGVLLTHFPLVPDIVVIVKAESVHLYCNPISYPLLLPYIAHWRNLHIHCLNKEEVNTN